MTAIIPFKFGVVEIRVLDRDGEPWFVLADVCSVLEIANTGNAASRLASMTTKKVPSA
jgi:prophage antirepressor-like protein